MSGTRTGGLKAAATNKLKYGEDFYHGIGHAGGIKSKGGGFSSMTHEQVSEIGKRGGKRSAEVRWGAKKKRWFGLKSS